MKICLSSGSLHSTSGVRTATLWRSERAFWISLRVTIYKKVQISMVNESAGISSQAPKTIAKDANNPGNLWLLFNVFVQQVEVFHAKTARESALCHAAVPAVACIH